jgi:hypothetical protein
MESRRDSPVTESKTPVPLADDKPTIVSEKSNDYSIAEDSDAHIEKKSEAPKEDPSDDDEDGYSEDDFEEGAGTPS